MQIVAPQPTVPGTALAAWWVGGLTLAERIAADHPPTTAPGAGDQPGAGVSERDRRRLERWRNAHDLGATGQFARRLADAGIDADGLLGLLGESPAALAGRVPRPDWTGFVDEALAGVANEGRVLADDLDWASGFGAVVSPFVTTAVRHLRSAARRSGLDTGLDTGVDLDSVLPDFADRLTRTLVRISARTLVLELNVSRVTGGLTGGTPRQRFTAFARRLACRPALADLLAEYPVLGRLLGQAGQRAVDSYLELLDRFAADRAALVATLLGGRDPGSLVEIDIRGDAHQGGRCVALLRFADASRVVYKPRSLTIHERFNELAGWLAGKAAALDLRTPRVLGRDGYGWVEFVEHRPCASAAEVTAFYRRLGGLMALLYAIDGRDVHYENLIAVADQPVLVDLETLLQPTLPGPRTAVPDPAVAAVADSVTRINLLPELIIGDSGALDISGLGGETSGTSPFEVISWDAAGTDEMRLVRRPATVTGGQNRPVLAERPVEPAAHLDALLSGFRTGYDTIAEHRAELIDDDGLLARCAEVEIRVVARATQTYATLLDESTHPDVLRDALDRDRTLDLLWAISIDDPARERLVRHEIADLWAGDIPLFVGRPGVPDLWTSGGERLAGVFDEPSLRRVVNRIRGLGDTDRDLQEWLIRATMAVRAETDGHRLTADRPAVAAADRSAVAAAGGAEAAGPEPRRLLAAARGIGERLLDSGLRQGDRINWLGVEALDGRYWTVRPLGAGLGHGYTGVAVFLAQLAALTGDSRYAEAARDAARPATAVLQMLASTPGAPALVGCGGFDGLGGIAYGLSRVGDLLDDPELATAAGHAVDLLAVASADDQQHGVLDGLAGGLAAMVAVWQLTGLPAAWRAAHRCAERLDAYLRLADPGAAPPGFGFGDIGVGSALLGFAAAGGGDRYAGLGGAALERGRLAAASGADTQIGWCLGVAGVALATAAPAGSGVARSADGRALTVLIDSRRYPDHSLCHGALGGLDALTVAAGTQDSAAAARPAFLTSVLCSIERAGPRCGTPGGIDSPGLLTGLAGIGYGLLRAGFPDRVPSVLLLAPGATIQATTPESGPTRRAEP